MSCLNDATTNTNCVSRQQMENYLFNNANNNKAKYEIVLRIVTKKKNLRRAQIHMHSLKFFQHTKEEERAEEIFSREIAAK